MFVEFLFFQTKLPSNHFNSVYEVFRFGFRCREIHNPYANFSATLPTFSPQPSCFFLLYPKGSPASSQVATAAFVKQRYSVLVLRSPPARAGVRILCLPSHSIFLFMRAQLLYPQGERRLIKRGIPRAAWDACPTSLPCTPGASPFIKWLSFPDGGLIGQVPDCHKTTVTRPGLSTPQRHWEHPG